MLDDGIERDGPKAKYKKKEKKEAGEGKLPPYIYT